MMNLSTLLPMAIQTVQSPRLVAERLMAMNLGRAVLWQALALVVVVSILLAEISNLALGTMTGTGTPSLFISPMRMGLIQLSLLVVMVFVIFWVGRACGGTGRFQDGLVLVVWLQFIMVCLQVVQTLALLVMPMLAWLVGIGGLILFLWLLTHFIAIAHGFASRPKVFLMIVATSFGFAFGLSLILAVIGVSVPGVE